MAYRIREAIIAANHHDEFKYLYESIYPYYKFTVDEDRGQVLVRLRKTDKERASGTIPSGMRRTHSRPVEKHLPDASTLTEIIGSAVKFGNEHRLVFPAAMLSEQDFERLRIWGVEAGWEIEEGEGSKVTLVKLIGAVSEDEGG